MKVLAPLVGNLVWFHARDPFFGLVDLSLRNTLTYRELGQLLLAWVGSGVELLFLRPWWLLLDYEPTARLNLVNILHRLVH